MKIKICGLSRECDIDFVNEACPDYIGFVFAKSRRKVSAEQAQLLKMRLDKKIISVGVFVNQEIDFITELVNKGIIDMVQLHGSEDNDYIHRLKEKAVCKIIKALNPENNPDYDVDYLLFDNGTGGTGKAFDWHQIKEAYGKPFFLAGGLNIDNIDQAIKIVDPYAVDISSGVETDGYKDKDKIIEIVRRIRNEQR